MGSANSSATYTWHGHLGAAASLARGGGSGGAEWSWHGIRTDAIYLCIYIRPHGQSLQLYEDEATSLHLPARCPVMDASISLTIAPVPVQFGGEGPRAALAAVEPSASTKGAVGAERTVASHKARASSRALGRQQSGAYSLLVPGKTVFSLFSLRKCPADRAWSEKKLPSSPKLPLFYRK